MAERVRIGRFLSRQRADLWRAVPAGPNLLSLSYIFSSQRNSRRAFALAIVRFSSGLSNQVRDLRSARNVGLVKSIRAFCRASCVSTAKCLTHSRTVLMLGGLPSRSISVAGWSQGMSSMVVCLERKRPDDLYGGHQAPPYFGPIHRGESMLSSPVCETKPDPGGRHKAFQGSPDGNKLQPCRLREWCHRPRSSAHRPLICAPSSLPWSAFPARLLATSSWTGGSAHRLWHLSRARAGGASAATPTAKTASINRRIF